MRVGATVSVRSGWYPYALGIVRTPLHLDRASPVLFNHNGAGYGFGSCFTYCPEQGLAWIALFNGQVRPGPPAPFDAIALCQALEATFGSRVPIRRPSKPAIAPHRETLAPYVGTYVAGLSVMTMDWEGDVFGFRLPGDDALNPLTFTEPNHAFVAQGPRAPYGVKLHPPDGVQPAWVQFEVEDVASYFGLLYGASFDFNDRDGEPPAAIDQAYDRFLGEYRVIQWGVPIMTVSLTKANGRLYLGPIRLVEHAPGLLFSATGEALDLTRDVPTFRNIPLHRVDAVMARD